MAYVFRGGIYFNDNKVTRKCQIEKLTPPKELYIKLSERGVTPAVAPGESVLRGQLIASSVGESCEAAYHSPVSGTVTAVGDGSDGKASVCYIEIENDMKYTVSPDIKKCEKRLSDCGSEEICEIIRRAGICGDGSSLPVYKRLEAASGQAECCIVSCIDGEPYVSCDHRFALERPAAVINGLKIVLKALGLRRGIIAIGEDQPDVAAKMRSVIGESRLVTVNIVPSKYPQRDDRQLIYALTGREISAVSEPSESGMLVFGAQSCAAIYSAFATGLPQLSRVITIDGDCVSRHANVVAPIGTRFSELAAFCGGLTRKPDMIISGGPMTGEPCNDINTASVGKATRAALFMSEGASDKYEQPHACIRCGRCVAACPMHLMPNYLYMLLRRGKHEEAVRRGALLCRECGVCSYICPGKAPIVELIREAKLRHAELGGDEK